MTRPITWSAAWTMLAVTTPALACAPQDRLAGP